MDSCQYLIFTQGTSPARVTLLEKYFICICGVTQKSQNEKAPTLGTNNFKLLFPQCLCTQPFSRAVAGFTLARATAFPTRRLCAILVAGLWGKPKFPSFGLVSLFSYIPFMSTPIRHLRMSFNTTGPCRPEMHYMLPPEVRLSGADLQRFVDKELYWVLHAPRQTGKTSFLMSWMKELNASQQVVAC